MTEYLILTLLVLANLLLIVVLVLLFIKVISDMAG